MPFVTPAVIDALVSTWTAAAPVGLTVFDGRPVDPNGVNFLAVGWDPSEQQAAAGESATLRTYQTAKQAREAEIACLLSCWSGTDQIRTVRQAAFDTLETFLTALAADNTLGGAAQLARVSEAQYVPVRVAEGTCVQLRFTITAQAHQ